MKLSEAGERRVRGYLFVLRRSLASFMPEDMAKESVLEVESHILERVSRMADVPDEAAALEDVLRHLGPPMRVAQAYAAEITFDEAIATGRPLPVLRALSYLSTSVGGFFAALMLFAGYAVSLGFVLVAVLKPVFPQNVGLVLRDGVPTALGALSTIGPGMEVVGGYELIPLCLLAGGITLVVTHRLARAFVGWWRGRLKGPIEG